MAPARTLVIGVGSIGERHTRCFGATGRVELGICEVSDSLRETVAHRYAIPHRYATLDDALQKRPWDVAVIATPAHLHVPMARQLVSAGLHVLIEKPFSTSLEGIEELIELVERRRRVASVAYIHRANPVVQSMHAAIASGRFGRPVQLVVVAGQHFPKYRPAYRSIYYARRETGGGAIQDALTHMVNLAELMVGPVERVAADAAHQVLEGVEVEDTVQALARHGDVLASYSLNQYQAPNETTLTVVCERGTARVELDRGRWISMIEPGGQWHEEFRFEGERDDAFIRQAHAFLDAVEGQKPVLCSLRDGLQTLRGNLALLKAVETASWVTVRDT